MPLAPNICYMFSLSKEVRTFFDDDDDDCQKKIESESFCNFLSRVE